MAMLVLQGPFVLTHTQLLRVLDRVSPGAFILGDLIEDHFACRYVGMAYSNLKKRLEGFVDKYGYFKMTYTPTARDAFMIECKLYHSLYIVCKLDNEMHPQCSEEYSWKCPVCR